MYVGCPESIHPLWISREPDAWPWCYLAASQRRPYCTSVNSHSLVGLVSRQWDAVDWACVLCDRGNHNDRASRSASSQRCAWPFYSSRAGFFLARHHITQMSAPLQPIFGSLRLVAFPTAEIAVEREVICTSDGHTLHKVSQGCLTADWLAPWESDCSRMCIKVSSDWLPSYIKAMQMVPWAIQNGRILSTQPMCTTLTETFHCGWKWELKWNGNISSCIKTDPLMSY